ncbi:MAG: bacteriohemerythrin [Proteobacteria bacterium]|nr:bacteriohemerythrin [Pseudomonadota bacterium]
MELSTGVPTLDEQHQAIFVCLNELEKAVGDKTMLSTIHALEQLRRYTHEHFAEEERLMIMVGYPRIDAHIAAHRDFRHRLLELRRTYLDHDISSELILMLREWLAEHIAGTDMDYVPYLTVVPGISANAKSSLWASA